jgi:hypothetical protein
MLSYFVLVVVVVLQLSLKANFLCFALGGFIDLGLIFEMGLVTQTFHF